MARQSTRTRIELTPSARLENPNSSITEFSRETAERYSVKIAANADRLLSINHESNAFRVRDLFAGHPMQRFPHWMRPGYVEEIANFR